MATAMILLGAAMMAPTGRLRRGIESGVIGRILQDVYTPPDEVEKLTWEPARILRLVK